MTALDWILTEGLSRLVQGAQSICADFPEVAPYGADETVAAFPVLCLEGQHVRLQEGVEGICIKHLVHEGRLRIKLDGEPLRTVWRMVECVCEQPNS